LRKQITRRLRKKPEGAFSAASKLGLASSLSALVFNAPVSDSVPPILRIAALDGHEIGLHGGSNHATWERSAHTWTEEQLYTEIATGLAALRACGVRQPVSFASPGWNSPARLAEILPALGFRILADWHDAFATTPRLTRPDLTMVPTNIIAQGSKAGYLEAMRTRKLSNAEILTDFRRQLAFKRRFAGVYEHPYFAAVHELPLLGELLRVVADEGFAVRTIRDAVAAASETGEAECRTVGAKPR
jgi:peptidoglycan/xylan/chitin deacetylase (PgdA/CDA1 family)